ncbi:MAG TPA: hypothetical protein VFX35_05880 [Solirubrobacterales bacterium]|nr:hypothetical protein [Solirubrobacterales bacterium]
MAVDAYGNIYVSSLPNAQPVGRVDVFDSEGVFITEIAGVKAPFSLAVDSKGNLYVVSLQPGEFGNGSKLLRYEPESYEPETGEIAYTDPPVVAVEELSSVGATGLAINPLNDHVFLHRGDAIEEYGSAEEENKLLDKLAFGTEDSAFPNLTVDAAHNRIYATYEPVANKPEIAVFDLTTHELLFVVSGSPSGSFKGRWLAVAADEGTGHFFVFDGEIANVVYEFDESGNYIATIEHQFKFVPEMQIAVDNGVSSPNGALNSGRYLYVPSDPGGLGHLYAFGPSTVCAPEIELLAAAEVTETEALFTASLEPCGAVTSYVFQYTSQEQFEKEGFAGAQTAGEGTIPAAKTPQSVSSPVTGLSPDTSYRFRVVATNSVDTVSAERTFTTYPQSDLGVCANAGFRIGYSALLPDCRAYELVTPGDTNARAPKGVDHLGVYFPTREASPAGDKVSFRIEGGTLPASPGAGAYPGDPYLATRGETGWTTTLAGPTGAETPGPVPGSTSPDQGFSFWNASGEGPAHFPGTLTTNYVRYPDGHSELVGRGSLGEDPQATGKLISENGGHIIFVTGEVSGKTLGEEAVQLEPNAPVSDTGAIYDRAAGGPTRVVSLLPGEKTPEPGEDARYLGASLDGRGVAFTIAGTLYLRYDNSATFSVGTGVTFAGVAEGGARIFYVQGGNLKAFDATSGKTISFTTSGDVTPVNVAPNGGAVYFISPSVLTGKATNPAGAKPKAGQNNLYLSREGTLSFVGTVTERDVVGREIGGVETVEGLGLWVTAVGGKVEAGELGGRFAVDPSRSTPDGSSLIFESRANLTAYDSEGTVQVYLFKSAEGTLRCLSCNPTGAAPSGSASLQSVSESKEDPVPLSSFGAINNLRADGRRAFFQSTEALVPTDTDGRQDVYEWEEQGVGTCTRSAGCVSLISSGGSLGTDYLYAVSDSGDDVFFSTGDLLLPSDTESTPSIYDARVGGGFAESARAECQGEGCRPNLSVPPALLAPGSSPSAKTGNVPRRCPKGKRKVKRHGKVRCVKRKHRHHKHARHKAGAKTKGAGK